MDECLGEAAECYVLPSVDAFPVEPANKKFLAVVTHCQLQESFMKIFSAIYKELLSNVNTPADQAQLSNFYIHLFSQLDLFQKMPHFQPINPSLAILEQNF